jgi:hypothetical protein
LIVNGGSIRRVNLLGERGWFNWIDENRIFTYDFEPLLYDCRTAMLERIPPPPGLTWPNLTMVSGQATVRGLVIRGESLFGDFQICYDHTLTPTRESFQDYFTTILDYEPRERSLGVPCSFATRRALPVSDTTLPIHLRRTSTTHANLSYSTYTLVFDAQAQLRDSLDTGLGVTIVQRSAGGMYFSAFGRRSGQSEPWKRWTAVLNDRGDTIGTRISIERMYWDSLLLATVSKPQPGQAPTSEIVASLNHGATWYQSPHLALFDRSDTSLCRNGDMLAVKGQVLARMRYLDPTTITTVGLPLELETVHEQPGGRLVGVQGRRLFSSDDGGTTWYDATVYRPELETSVQDVEDIGLEGGEVLVRAADVILAREANGRYRVVRQNRGESLSRPWSLTGIRRLIGTNGREDRALVIPDGAAKGSTVDGIASLDGSDSVTDVFVSSSVPSTGASFLLRVDGDTLTLLDAPTQRKRRGWITGACAFADTVFVTFLGTSDAAADTLIRESTTALSVDGGRTFTEILTADAEVYLTSPVHTGTSLVALQEIVSAPRLREQTVRTCALVRSKDGGQTWNAVLPAETAVLPTSDRRIIRLANGTLIASLGGTELYTSTTSGATWQVETSFAPARIRALATSADTVVVLHEAGAARRIFTTTTVQAEFGQHEFTAAAVAGGIRLVVPAGSGEAVDITVHDVLGRRLGFTNGMVDGTSRIIHLTNVTHSPVAVVVTAGGRRYGAMLALN